MIMSIATEWRDGMKIAARCGIRKVYFGLSLKGAKSLFKSNVKEKTEKRPEKMCSLF